MGQLKSPCMMYQADWCDGWKAGLTREAFTSRDGTAPTTAVALCLTVCTSCACLLAAKS